MGKIDEMPKCFVDFTILVRKTKIKRTILQMGNNHIK